MLNSELFNECIEKAVNIANQCEDSLELANLYVEIAKAMVMNRADVNRDNNAWQPNFDEDGIPVISKEDELDPEKVLKYRMMMNDPEVQKRIKARDKKAGEEAKEEAKEIANDSKKKPGTKSSAKVKPSTKNKKEDTPTDENISFIEELREVFEEDVLNDFVLNLTENKYTSLEALPESFINSFAVYMRDNIQNAYDELEKIKEEYGADTVEAQLEECFGVEGATLDDLNDGVIIRFVIYLRNVIAQGEFQQFIEQFGEDLLPYIQEYVGSDKATLESITEENVEGFVELIKKELENNS